MTNRDRAKKIYDMLGQGQLLEAFDEFYAEDVVMTEPRGTRKGKADCRSYEEQFLQNVAQFHGMEVRGIGADDETGRTFVEVAMDVEFKDGNRANMEQVAVQTWKDGKIVHERFYYDNSGS